MFGRVKRLTEQRNVMVGVAAERLDTIADMQRRIDELHRRLEAQRAETSRAYAENARLRVQREELTEHLGHALDQHGPYEDFKRPLPTLSTVAPCPACSGRRKVHAGEDGVGEVVIPCSECCCYVCGEYTGGGLCEADMKEQVL